MIDFMINEKYAESALTAKIMAVDGKFMNFSNGFQKSFTSVMAIK